MSQLTPMELLDLGLKTTLILATAGLLARALRHASAATRHLVWTLAVAATLALPSLRGLAPQWGLPLLPAGLVRSATGEAPTSERTTATAWAPSPDARESRRVSPPVPRAAAVPAWAAPSETATHVSSLPEPAWTAFLPAVEGGAALFLAWLAGAVVVGLGLLGGMARLWFLARRSAPLTDPSWSSLVFEIAATLGLKRAVRLIEGPVGSMPMGWGIVHPVVLLPAGASAWPESRRRAVLTHELAHVVRHDCLTQALAHAACVLYWFHPLAWVAARRLRVERELACDDLVLRSGTSGPDYADQLLQLARFARATAHPSWAAVAMARPSQLEGRLLSILDGRHDRRGPSRRGVLALAAAFALGITGLAGLSPWASPALAAQPLATALVTEGAGEALSLPMSVPANAAPAALPAGKAPSGQTPSSPSPDPTAEGAVGQFAQAHAEEHEHEQEQEQRHEERVERSRSRVPSEKVVAALGEALGDADAEVRKQAVHSLAQLRAQTAVPALTRALADSEPEVRSQAAFALGELRATGAAEGLRKALTTDAVAEVRQQAAFALGQLKDAGSVPALTAAVKDKDADVRQQAVFALGELRAASAVPALTAAVQDTDADVRQQAVFALGQLRSEAAVSPLMGALKDGQPDVRAQAAFALGEIRNREAVPALIGALGDANADVRQQAAFALGHLRDARAAEPLAKALKDADVDVRKQAAFALGELED